MACIHVSKRVIAKAGFGDSPAMTDCCPPKSRNITHCCLRFGECSAQMWCCYRWQQIQHQQQSILQSRSSRKHLSHFQISMLSPHCAISGIVRGNPPATSNAELSRNILSSTFLDKYWSYIVKLMWRKSEEVIILFEWDPSWRNNRFLFASRWLSLRAPQQGLSLPLTEALRLFWAEAYHIALEAPLPWSRDSNSGNLVGGSLMPRSLFRPLRGWQNDITWEESYYFILKIFIKGAYGIIAICTWMLTSNSDRMPAHGKQKKSHFQSPRLQSWVGLCLPRGQLQWPQP